MGSVVSGNVPAGPGALGCGCFQGLGEADGILYRVKRKKLSDFPSGTPLSALGVHDSGFIAALAEIKAKLDGPWSSLV